VLHQQPSRSAAGGGLQQARRDEVRPSGV